MLTYDKTSMSPQVDLVVLLALNLSISVLVTTQ